MQPQQPARTITLTHQLCHKLDSHESREAPWVSYGCDATQHGTHTTTHTHT